MQWRSAIGRFASSTANTSTRISSPTCSRSTSTGSKLLNIALIVIVLTSQFAGHGGLKVVNLSKYQKTSSSYPPYIHKMPSYTILPHSLQLPRVPPLPWPTSNCHPPPWSSALCSVLPSPWSPSLQPHECPPPFNLLLTKGERDYFTLSNQVSFFSRISPSKKNKLAHIRNGNRGQRGKGITCMYWNKGPSFLANKQEDIVH